ncbi:MAG: WD40 repeat domain-containing protein [Bacteroidales bacterium]|nr:WD40 repeat domain-containing protein [Bacteroidales bacterium]
MILLFVSVPYHSIAQISLIKTIDLPKSIIEIEYSPDGNSLAVLHANKQIHLFNTRDYSNTAILDDKGEGDVSIAYSPDGNYLLAGSWDKSIKLWDLSKNKIIRRYFGHSQATRSVTFNPQGNLVVSAGWDLDIRFWYVPTGLNLKNLSGHTQCVRSIAFSPDGTKLATGGYDQLLKLWDIATGKEIFSVKTSSFPIEVVVFSPDASLIATAGLENTVKIWNAKNGNLVKALKGHTDAVYALAFSPDGKYLVSGGNDNTIHIWNIEKGTSVYQLKGHSQGIRSLCFKPDGKQLASGAVDKTVKIWNTSALNISPLEIEKPPLQYQNPTNITINSPAQNPFVSTKRILPISFEIKNSQFNLVQLFLNKTEYTRMIDGKKEIVKPISVKVNTNKNIEINYEIYLDYETSEIQLAAFKPNSNEFILSPELLVSYFDIEKFSEETDLYVCVLNVQKYSDKKFTSDIIKDNPEKFISLLAMQEQKLFNSVVVRNFTLSELTPEMIQQCLDSIVLYRNQKSMILIAINGFIIQEVSSQKYFLLLPSATTKDVTNALFPIDNFIKTILKTKATAGIFINASNKTSKLPENYQIADDEQLNKYIDKELIARKGIFYLSLNHIQPLPMFDLLANSLHPNNDVDKNSIIDIAEMSAFLNQLAKIRTIYRPSFIPFYKK